MKNTVIIAPIARYSTIRLVELLTKATRTERAMTDMMSEDEGETVDSMQRYIARCEQVRADAREDVDKLLKELDRRLSLEGAEFDVPELI